MRQSHGRSDALVALDNSLVAAREREPLRRQCDRNRLPVHAFEGNKHRCGIGGSTYCRPKFSTAREYEDIGGYKKKADS
jgi:hypothetical protein